MFWIACGPLRIPHFAIQITIQVFPPGGWGLNPGDRPYFTNLRNIMTKKPTLVADDVVVEIEYTLTVDGEVLDSSKEDGPLEYLHGYDNIVPGLEKALTGKTVGDNVKVTIKPEDGYGEHDKEAIVFVPRMEIPAEIPLEEGTEIVMEDDDGDYVTAVIAWIGPDEVKLDFNHPLAGFTLHFDVEVIGLREATEEELDHGHVHADGHHHHDED